MNAEQKIDKLIEEAKTWLDNKRFNYNNQMDDTDKEAELNAYRWNKKHPKNHSNRKTKGHSSFTAGEVSTKDNIDTAKLNADKRPRRTIKQSKPNKD